MVVGWPRGGFVMIALSLCGLAIADSADAPVSAEPQGSGVLKVGRLRVGKVLILGNSITLHAPAPSIGWAGNWGMAATALEKDFAHLLQARISKAAGGVSQLKVKNIAEFERNLAEYNIQEKLSEELAFGADVVVVAIGENVAALKSEADREQFASCCRQLLRHLTRHAPQALVVRSSFWEDPEKDQIMKAACDEAKGIFVDIGKLGRDEANYARSEQKIEHAGVAAHPGDKGMAAIADELWRAIANVGDAKK